MSKGFFVPHSVSGNYVSTQRNRDGAYKWDTSVNEVGLGQQAAFHSLNQQYSTTINNAYSSYLMANRGIQGSAMGQGYKEAYMQKSQQELIDNIAETNLNAGAARSQFANEGIQQIGLLDKQFKTEVSNMDRVAHSAKDYLSYLNNLSGENDINQKYFDENKRKLTIDDLYEDVFRAQPGKSFRDIEGNPGMSYTEWVNANLKNNTADITWSQWLFGEGGLNQFRDATKKGIQPLFTKK